MAMLVKHTPTLSRGLSLVDPIGATMPEAPAVSWTWRVRELIQTSARHPLPILADALVAGAALAVAGSPPSLTLFALILVPLGIFAGLYRNRSCIETQGVLWYLRALVLPLALTLFVLSRLQPPGTHRWDGWRAVSIMAIALVAMRGALWLDLARGRRRGIGLRRALVSGPAPAVAHLLRRINAFPECGVRAVAIHTPAVGTHDNRRDPGRRQAGPPPGTVHTRALDLVAAGAIDTVVAIGSTNDRGSVEELVRGGDGTGVDYNVAVPMAGLAGPFRPRIGDIGVLPIGQVNYGTQRMRGKRVFDVAVSGAALLFLAPMLGLIALAVKLYSPGPAFYGQLRVGRDGRVFRMWKFRSMVVGADAMVDEHADENVNDGLLFKIKDDPRITPVGAVLRRLSLDELPQLFNVLRGEMSFVGPRPLPVEPDAFDELAAKRHSVRPGITGPWQVHGGHALSYDDMVSLDLSYITGWRFRHDMWLLFLTLPALLVRRADVI